MRAMILAAGLGERMRPLTDHRPKPLLRVAGRALIDYHIDKLVALGCRELVINVSHLADQVLAHCGDGSRWGARIQYSHEAEPLETAGGIARALPLLGDAPFLVVNGDVWTELSFEHLLDCRPPVAGAHLVMVDSPPHHPGGDFLLDDAGWLRERPPRCRGLTYAGVGVFDPQFFAGLTPGKLALRPLLDAALPERRLRGEHYRGAWEDVGTPRRLAELDARLRGTGVDG